MIEIAKAAAILGALKGASLRKSSISNLDVLNEAYAYEKPSSFSRGLRIDLGEIAILLISGTASIDEHGNSVHVGDFRAQTNAHSVTSAGCSRLKAQPGTMLCELHVICAILIATTMLSMKNEPHFIRTLTRSCCRHPRVSKPSFAVRNCSWKSEAIAMYLPRAAFRS